MSLSTRHNAHSGPTTIIPFVAGNYLWLVVVVVAAIAPWLAKAANSFKDFPKDWVIPLASWINAAMETLVAWLEPLTRALSLLLEWPMIVLRDALQWLPWPASVAAVALLAWHASGLRLAIICTVALLYVALSGHWQPAMNTMALVGIAVPLSLTLGLILGIAAQRTKLGAYLVSPALDVMQTMPTFAYLIPLLVLFGFGPVVGLIASAVYACPPMVRNVVLGLQRVPTETVEAARVAGSSALQQLFWVELPAAMAQIKVGINQTIMAALSMVIIASVIGGFDDIGWEVLSTMRRARFGESLLAGFVIVLIAVCMDRISAAYANRAAPGESIPRGNARFWLLSVIALGCITITLKAFGDSLVIEDPSWVRQFAAWLNSQLDRFVVAYGALLTSIKNNFFFFYLLPIRIGFSQAILPFTWGFDFTETLRWAYLLAGLAGCTWLLLTRSWQTALCTATAGYLLYFGLTGVTWPVIMLAVTVLASRIGGFRLALFSVLALLFILLTGMWERAMLSLYLCGAAAFMSFALGASIGVCAANNDRLSRLFRPLCDTLQTIPLFVFLIPVLMFFQVGEFTALLAIVAYAFVPAVRYTEAGLRQVPKQLLEVAVAQGCNARQIFWQIKLPLAMPAIMVGLNQTVMYSFAMLVIAALVGTTGLGQQIFLALGAADTGLGLIAGLSMALLAMLVDRMLQQWALQKFPST